MRRRCGPSWRRKCRTSRRWRRASWVSTELRWKDRLRLLGQTRANTSPVVFLAGSHPAPISAALDRLTDRAADAQRMNLRENRPDVQESSARVADYYHQRGVSCPELTQLTSTVLGGFVKTEAAAHGIQSGLRFLSLTVGSVGLLITALLAASDLARRR